MKFERRFDGQIAVVTGGADGIGRAVAGRLRDEGARVVVFDRKPAQGFESFEVDIGDEPAVASAYERVLGRHERLDAVVHCAGVVGPNNIKTEDVSVDDFDFVYRVNLRGSFLVLKHALPTMLKQDYGRVLLFASIAGKEGNAGMTPYSATKAGMLGLVKAAGKEVATTGVTVNAIAPAVVRTGMVDAMHPDQVKYMTDKIPAKRCGTLEEAAALACWAVSREASFCTGFCFDLSGGRATY
ncbi:MAG: SDR family NAD(P)-dependent oxidoreductase [Tepidisphaeraceae bacterium]